MFGIGFQELVLILVVALIVLGPNKLPEVARTLGKVYREIKNSIDDVKTSVMTDIYVSDIKKEIEDKKYVEPIKNKDEDFEKTFENEIKKDSKQKEVEIEKISFKKDKSEVWIYGWKSITRSTINRTLSRT